MTGMAIAAVLNRAVVNLSLTPEAFRLLPRQEAVPILRWIEDRRLA